MCCDQVCNWTPFWWWGAQLLIAVAYLGWGLRKVFDPPEDTNRLLLVVLAMALLPPIYFFLQGWFVEHCQAVTGMTPEGRKTALEDLKRWQERAGGIWQGLTAVGSAVLIGRLIAREDRRVKEQREKPTS